ncbi:MAG TPA: alcohol dehydrogenase catalytic domain-containing protein [Phycisphaerae bacterium]|nr:alcohol dehydrogenase catalytic domain-containing protein [Phycisphaerae bacterium]
MLALVFDGKVSLRDDYPEPKPKAGEALVAVRMAGICRTDLEILKGYMDFRGVMGHEFVGMVLKGPRAWAGKRVVAEINCICGQCDMCTSGLANHCRHRTVLGIAGRDGVFAERVCIPARNLHEVPPGVEDVSAVFAEPLAAAFQVVRQVRFDRSDKVVVIGDGRLGQLVARVLKLAVHRPLLVGRHEGKLEAAEKQGIETALADRFVPAAQADVVIDASGSASGFDLAMRTVRPRGTIVLKSTFAAAAGTLNLAPVVINEVNVIGSRCGPFPDALKALAAGQVDVSALVSRRYPLRDAMAALDAAADPQNIKVVIDVQ